jgi:serine/threonine protein kinase
MSEHPATGDWPAPAEAALWPAVPGYEILEELGRGGMGVVYKARQASLKRLVALKMIRDSALAGAQERARFRIEAEAAARMRHPHIVAIYEIGEHAGRPYFAMEFVEGGSLDQYLASRPQVPAQAATLVRTLALAVQHAHEQKIVHRDLKPANILLRGMGKGERAKAEGTGPRDSLSPLPIPLCPMISDFGLAKRLDSDSTAWTREGAILGTASYMAPEQAAGRGRDIGPAVDLYALGAILYELLTGRPPFQGDSWNETLQKVLQEEPVPLARFQPEVPRELETVCLKCLEKEPGRRYASAGELADDLGRVLDGKPVVAVPLGAKERLARLAGRDGYQIIDELGRGPRSTVYHARYEPLNQPVALKVFREGICTREEWEARLRRGADLWAAVAHPNVIPVHRAGWWDGVPYLVLEYVPHGSLAAKLVGRPRSVRAALRLVEPLAEIVGYLHRQGVVHGNLKPSNILLAPDGIPRIADFRLTGGLFQGPLPTEDEDPLGLSYLAPEVLRDPSAEPRPYSDIYGLGIILYALLTGRPPFAGTTTPQVLEQVRSQDPEPPSRRNRDVTPNLDRFCLRCLRKNPWRRYARAYDVSLRLKQFKDKPDGRGIPGPRGPERRPPDPEPDS